MIRQKIIKVCQEELGIVGMPIRLRLMQGLISLLPYMTAGRVRTALYRLAGVRIGSGSVILGSLRLWGRHRLSIGAYASINSPCAINLDADVTIGNGVYIGNDVMILTASHGIGSRICRARGEGMVAPVVIEDGAWVAAGVMILPGVVIGSGSVVAAGAVVTRNVAADTLVGGVPARVIRHLPTEEVQPVSIAEMALT